MFFILKIKKKKKKKKKNVIINVKNYLFLFIQLIYSIIFYNVITMLPILFSCVTTIKSLSENSLITISVWQFSISKANCLLSTGKLSEGVLSKKSVANIFTII